MKSMMVSKHLQTGNEERHHRWYVDVCWESIENSNNIVQLNKKKIKQNALQTKKHELKALEKTKYTLLYIWTLSKLSAHVNSKRSVDEEI